MLDCGGAIRASPPANASESNDRRSAARILLSIFPGGEKVTDNETLTERSSPASPASRRRAPVKRRASARKAPARKKAARRPRSRARTATGLAALLDGLATKAAAAGKEMKTLSGQGTV